MTLQPFILLRRPCGLRTAPRPAPSPPLPSRTMINSGLAAVAPVFTMFAVEDCEPQALVRVVP